MSTRKALFLDRDGVINVDRGYVYRIEDIEFIDGICELVRTARELGYLLIVATNQAGIGRGLYGELDLWHLTNWMLGRFEQEGCPIAAVYYCPFHPDHGTGKYRIDSPDRKPNPGMLLRARTDFALDLAACALLGDKMSDIEAANAAGVGFTGLFSTTPAANDPATRTVRSLFEFATMLAGSVTARQETI